jgi:hypothetical protein
MYIECATARNGDESAWKVDGQIADPYLPQDGVYRLFAASTIREALTPVDVRLHGGLWAGDVADDSAAAVVMRAGIAAREAQCLGDRAAWAAAIREMIAAGALHPGNGEYEATQGWPT